jgi:hypothetical protein
MNKLNNNALEILTYLIDESGSEDECEITSEHNLMLLIQRGGRRILYQNQLGEVVKVGIVQGKRRMVFEYQYEFLVFDERQGIRKSTNLFAYALSTWDGIHQVRQPGCEIVDGEITKVYSGIQKALTVLAEKWLVDLETDGFFNHPNHGAGEQ